MVYLNRIYTKSGDAGETSLGDGTRVPKSHARIVAHAGIDELNSVVGVAISGELPEQIGGWLQHIQHDLFDIGADLCLPETEPAPDGSAQTETSRPALQTPSAQQPLRVTAEQIETLEKRIDTVNERLDPLKSFVLPGGSPAAARLHHARTVCRRVEIAVVQLAEHEKINPNIAIYLNRLSDLLFVLARASNSNGRDDILWVPGESRA